MLLFNQLFVGILMLTITDLEICKSVMKWSFFEDTVCFCAQF